MGPISNLQESGMISFMFRGRRDVKWRRVKGRDREDDVPYSGPQFKDSGLIK
jgi:hypothetical protein